MELLVKITKELKSLKNPDRAKVSAWFFKTGQGQYGQGDVFLGINVPNQREIAKKYKHLTLPEIKTLLKSPFHEFRFTALEILVMQFEKGENNQKQKIFKFYIQNSKNINNWDLVDTSAPYIVGEHLLGKERSILYKLAKSNNLWQKRIAIVATLAFIRQGQFADTLNISKLLLKDNHDLIHKAVGWALREVGKKNKKVVEKFLRDNYKNLPRTTLRYAIEKFSKPERLTYLKLKH